MNDKGQAYLPRQWSGCNGVFTYMKHSFLPTANGAAVSHFSLSLSQGASESYIHATLCQQVLIGPPLPISKRMVQPLTSKSQSL